MSTAKTVEQWLEQEDLATELGRVLTPKEEWKHEIYPRRFKTDQETVWCCHKCKGEWPINQEGRYCSVPDPIDIKDWNVAMKWRDKLGHAEMIEIWKQQRDVILGLWKWWTIQAQPKHYLIAAAMVAEREEE